MFAKTDATKRIGFLARLRKDESGNVIAILAAAMFPAIGIIGGSVDMSRVYLTRTTLQSACDAGSLMGRRQMATGTWAADDDRANTRALQMFDTNFAPGQYGSENLQRSFTESGGTVTGVASATLPMSLMSVFGIEDQTITVTCTSELRIPSSDIMFVLDTTGSMNCPDNGNSCPNGNNNNVEASNAKIKGLRTAASCFYEALAKQNITAVSAAACGEAEDPAGSTSDVRLRFGFVPYSVNVNVGRLLPLEYMADQWTYQSRQATLETASSAGAYDPVYGTEPSPTQTGTQPQSAPGDTSWANLSTNLIHPTNGQTYSYIYQRANSGATCASGIPSVTGTTTGSLVANGQSPTTPVYGTHNSVTRYYYRDNTGQTYQYRYSQTQQGNGNNRRYYCQLQRRTVNQSATRINYSAVVPITWVYNPGFLYWTYKPTTFNVSGLKNGAGNSWNSAVNLPLGDNGSNRSITWNGCVEERQTERVMDDDPSDNWNPIPENALDMDIELEPVAGNLPTLWGPMLGQTIYRKYDGSSAFTTTNFQTAENGVNRWVTYNGNSYYPQTVTEYCPTEAKLYSEMGGDAFWGYLEGLRTGGNTYHDVGLLWGARLMAPNGIFQSVTSSTDDFVERHMIFMTDGDTSVNSSDYSSHGIHWWDRRQNSGTVAPSKDWLESNVNARTQALCKWVRDENITLWVVAFGQGIAQATKDDLEACATSGRYFEAANTAGLITQFKDIAGKISALRLTQ